MHKREIKEAFSQLHASEDLVKEVIALKYEKKNSLSAARVIRRVAVCAAVVALVIGMTVALWPRREEPGEQLGMPTMGTTEPTELLTTLPEMPTTPTETKGYELVKLSNVVKLYSYSQESVSEEELKKYEITDGISTYQPCWIEYTGAAFWGVKLKFYLSQDYYGDAELSFKVFTHYGCYFGKNDETAEDENGIVVEISNGEILSWKPGDDLKCMKETLNPDAIYVNILIYADDQPVGFGLLELSCLTTPAGPYAVTLRRFRTNCYPLVDGQFQDVTEEYLWAQIEECEQAMHEEYMEQLPEMLERINQAYEESRLN